MQRLAKTITLFGLVALSGCTINVYMPQPIYAVLPSPAVPMTRPFGPGPVMPPPMPETNGSSPAPVITGVTGFNPNLDQPIVISGHGFGAQAPFSGDTPYLMISDVSRGWNAGSNRGEWTPNVVTVNVTSWTDDQIVISGFPSGYGQQGWIFGVGDTVDIQVWNPQTGAGPSQFRLVLGQRP
ncbi:MAG: hypothetical protein PHU07_10955 [Acidocella sp.]|nr:hypothetical protein [Acidocella sp.]